MLVLVCSIVGLLVLKNSVTLYFSIVVSDFYVLTILVTSIESIESTLTLITIDKTKTLFYFFQKPNIASTIMYAYWL